MIVIHLILIYLSAECILRKLLTVQKRASFFLYPHCSARFRQSEHLILTLFALGILLTVWEFYHDPRLYARCLTLVFLLQFLVWSVRGAEEWLYRPQTKQHISCWMGAALMFIYACLFYFL